MKGFFREEFMMKKLNPTFKFKNISLYLFIVFTAFVLIGCTGANQKSSEEFIGVSEKPDSVNIFNQKTASVLGEEKEEEIVEENQALTQELRVHFIDLGQADSVLIQQGNEFMLIDGGNNEDSELLVSYLKEQGVNHIKYLIATHPHEDHIGGLDAVINAFNIEKLIMPNITHNTRTFEDLLLAVQKKNLKITAPKVGDSYELGEGNWTILAPYPKEYEDLNNYSVVISYAYGSHTFLFTGDAEKEAEFDMLKENVANPEIFKADVLKVGHHGSSSSTSLEFLDAVSPSFAVISVGAQNDYNHPHEETIKRLQERNIEILRTDLNGNIIFFSDGKELTYITGKKADVTKKTTIDKLPERAIIISHLDKKEETVTVQNCSNQDLDLSDWYLLSVTGNQKFIFPDGYILKAAFSVVIASGDSKGDLHWTAKNVWNNSKSDPAELYDNMGNLIYRWND